MNEPYDFEDSLSESVEFAQAESQEQKAQGFSIEEYRKHIPPWSLNTEKLIPPFTYFGGKRLVALEIWQRFGVDVPNYIEPFAGGLSVLLSRPLTDLRQLNTYRELANDANLFLLNFWRAVQKYGAGEIIKIADFPAHETEILSRRGTMMSRFRELHEKFEKGKDEKFCDLETAAYWLYIQREWIGAGSDKIDLFPDMKMPRAKPSGFLGDSLEEHIEWLQIRTKNVRFFATADWMRPIKSDTQTKNIGTTAVFLDPPYIGTTDVYPDLMDGSGGDEIPIAVRKWALENGDLEHFRIAYCGYLEDNEGFFPEGVGGWTKRKWQLANGMRAQDSHRPVDTIWFSPHCNPLPGDTVEKLNEIYYHSDPSRGI